MPRRRRARNGPGRSSTIPGGSCEEPSAPSHERSAMRRGFTKSYTMPWSRPSCVYTERVGFHHDVSNGPPVSGAFPSQSGEIEMTDVALQIQPHLTRLMRYARSLVRNPVQADDLVQDTVVRALEKAHLYENNTNLRGWLVTIMHNEHVNSVRRSMRGAVL